MNPALSKINLFMLDMDGTIYLGDRLFDCTIPFLAALREMGKHFIFLTNNSSKDASAYVGKLGRLGITVTERDIFTSGEATTLFLNQNFSRARLCVVGTPSLQNEFRKARFELSDDTPDCVVLGFDTTLDYAKLTLLCSLVRKGLPYIATHPDLSCPIENGFIPDVGATIAYVKAVTGREPDHIVGKPNATIAKAAMEKYGFAPDEVAMVGDRLYTDIALGASAGITSILVFSGETSREDYARSEIRATFCFDDLSGIIRS